MDDITRLCSDIEYRLEWGSWHEVHCTLLSLSVEVQYKLVMELITLPFSEQNEVWSSLRVPYHPSVLYKAKMIVYRIDPKPDLPKVEEKSFQVSQ